MAGHASISLWFAVLLALGLIAHLNHVRTHLLTEFHTDGAAVEFTGLLPPPPGEADHDHDSHEPAHHAASDHPSPTPTKPSAPPGPLVFFLSEVATDPVIRVWFLPFRWAGLPGHVGESPPDPLLPRAPPVV